MPRARFRLLARCAVYGSLAVALLVALHPPQGLSRSLQAGESSADPALRATHVAILTRYLSSTPGHDLPALRQALRELNDTSLANLIVWLTLPAEQRPAALFDGGLRRENALFSALLKTSLCGINCPPLDAVPGLLNRLPMEHTDRLRLRLLRAVSARAAREGGTALRLDCMAAAARHRDSGWEEVAALIDAAREARAPAAAISLLQDWLDDPPPQEQPRIAAARRALAQFQLLANAPQDAWTTLQPLLAEDAPAPDADTLAVAWSASRLLDKPVDLTAALERHLRLYPQHQLHWRELAAAPAPAADYLLWLDRLAQSCLQSGNESRALEMHLHLAVLESPQRLLPVLQAADRLERLTEVFDLLERAEQTRTTADTMPLALQLAEQCLRQEDSAGATLLLRHWLERHAQDAPAQRLLLQAKSDGLPAMQTVLLWRRHLQEHPGDLAAKHKLVEAWLRAGQPVAAVNHLLAQNPAALDGALRVLAARLAFEQRQNSAFVTALRRALDAGDAPPPDSTALWHDRLTSLGEAELASRLDAAAR